MEVMAAGESPVLSDRGMQGTLLTGFFSSEPAIATSYSVHCRNMSNVLGFHDRMLSMVT